MEFEALTIQSVGIVEFHSVKEESALLVDDDIELVANGKRMVIGPGIFVEPVPLVGEARTSATLDRELELGRNAFIWSVFAG